MIYDLVPDLHTAIRIHLKINRYLRTVRKRVEFRIKTFLLLLNTQRIVGGCFSVLYLLVYKYIKVKLDRCLLNS